MSRFSALRVGFLPLKAHKSYHRSQLKIPTRADMTATF
jgi:hypothetical protein